MENYAPFVVYMVICVIAIALATSKKARCLFIAVVLCAVVFYGVLSLHGAARAENDTAIVEIDDYIVSSVFNNGNPELEIQFRFEGNILAFYWDCKLDTSRPLKVTIWLPELECVDAEYKEV